MPLIHLSIIDTFQGPGPGSTSPQSCCHRAVAQAFKWLQIIGADLVKKRDQATFHLALSWPTTTPQ
jgi:hypothetical protein